MHGLSRYLIFVSVLATMAACSSFHAKAKNLVSGGGIADHASGTVPSEAPDLYRGAVDALGRGKYDEALAGFDRFIQQNPASPFTQAATLNSGRALEGLKNWQGAIDRYHEVVRATASAPKLQATALYRLSFCHESLGDDAQVVVDLNDLLSHANGLPKETAQGELPARLAAAYARIGNFERAQEFYSRAEAGITKLRKAYGGKVPEWLPKTLFLMGDCSNRQFSWNDFEPAIRSFARSQVYLLEAAELNQQPWANRGADELIRVYNTLVTTIEGAPVPDGDPLLAKRALQHLQWDRAGLMVDLETELRARLLPESKNSVLAPTLRILKMLAETDRRLAKLLIDRPAGEGLTNEAAARKKSGQSLAPFSEDDSLEQKFLKKSREMKPTMRLVPSPAPLHKPITDQPIMDLPAPIRVEPSRQPEIEDPNL